MIELDQAFMAGDSELKTKRLKILFFCIQSLSSILAHTRYSATQSLCLTCWFDVFCIIQVSARMSCLSLIFLTVHCIKNTS